MGTVCVRACVSVVCFCALVRVRAGKILGHQQQLANWPAVQEDIRYITKMVIELSIKTNTRAVGQVASPLLTRRERTCLSTVRW